MRRFIATNTEATQNAASSKWPVTSVILAWSLVLKMDISRCPNNAQNKVINVPSILTSKRKEKVISFSRVGYFSIIVKQKPNLSP